MLTTCMIVPLKFMQGFNFSISRENKVLVHGAWSIVYLIKILVEVSYLIIKKIVAR